MTGKRRQGRDPVPPASDGKPPATPPAPPAPAPAASRTSRRQARLARRRSLRLRLGAVGIVVAAVVAAAILAGVAVGVHHVTSHGSGSPQREASVLLQVQGPDRTALASAFLGHHNGTPPGVEVLIPSRLITDVCGFGSEPFGDILAQDDGVNVSRQTLTSLLNGVRIDGSWILTTAQLGKLVDLVHGVTVDVDVNVVQHTTKGDVLAIPRGNAKSLNGAQAAMFATYVASAGEDASAQLARLQQVLDALVAKLPPSAAVVAADLRQLGSSGASSLGVGRLSTLLGQLRADGQRSGALYPTDLPVKGIDAGGSPAYSVDTAAVQTLLTKQLSPWWPSDQRGRRISVELLNGVGTPGLVRTACPKLQAHGLVFAGSGNAGSFSNDRSQVEVASVGDQAVGEQVTAALGLPASDVTTAAGGQTVADVVVVLGSDYKP